MTGVFTQKWLKYILFGSFLAILLTFWFFFSHKSSPDLTKPVFITLTDHGFEPETIKITKGQLVSFITTKDTSFWPASSQHPSHGEWPEFDPKHAIAPDDSWGFTFNRVGVWDFHNHLNATQRGTVVVLGADGETEEECLDRSTQGRRSIQPKCWESEFTEAIDKDGLTGAFTLLKQYLSEDSLFRANCHDVMHIVGDDAYNIYKDTGLIVFDAETSACGFGFYHGFIEKMIRETGDYTESKNYCNTLENSEDFESPILATFAAINCRHGIGHAVFDSQASSDWGSGKRMMDSSIAVCESIFNNPQEQVDCVSGVSNALAIAYNNLYFNLSFDTNNHFEVCQNIKDTYQLHCFIEIGVHYTNSQKLSPQDALGLFIQVAPSDQVPDIFSSYILNGIQQHENNSDTIKASKELCQSFTDDAIKKGCMFGVLHGLTKSMDKKKYVPLSVEFCSLFTPKEQKLCTEKIVLTLKFSLTSEEMQIFCEENKNRLNLNCGDILRL